MVKEKFPLKHAMRAHAGRIVIALLFLQPRRNGWLTPRTGRFTSGEEPRYSLHRRLSGTQGLSRRMRNISRPPGFDPRPSRPWQAAIPTELSRPTYTCSFVRNLPPWCSAQASSVTGHGSGKLPFGLCPSLMYDRSTCVLRWQDIGKCAYADTPRPAPLTGSTSAGVSQGVTRGRKQNWPLSTRGSTEHHTDTPKRGLFVSIASQKWTNFRKIRKTVPTGRVTKSGQKKYIWRPLTKVWSSMDMYIPSYCNPSSKSNNCKFHAHKPLLHKATRLPSLSNATRTKHYTLLVVQTCVF